MKKSTQTVLASLVVPTLFAGTVFAMTLNFRGKTHVELPSTSERSFNLPPCNASANGMVSLGRDLFVQSCARCHGYDARGKGEDDDGPDLHGLRISDARIKSVLLKGVKGEMPSFAKKFSPEDTTALVSYLRSLDR